MAAIRLLIVDDHAMVRAGLRALLEGIEGVQVVAEASDGTEAVRLVAQHRPHVALIDLSMPGLNGLEATRRITQAFPETRVIVLSMHAARLYVLEALRAGASAYLLKSAAFEELRLAVRSVTRGETYLSPAIAAHVVEDVRHGGGGGAAPLTSRQQEVLRLIAQGKTTKEIAATLGVGARTVETHRAEIMRRLDIHDVAGLVRYAISVGLVPPEP